MRKEDSITVNGIEIKVKELTVAEVRHWMMDMLSKDKAKEDQDIASVVLDQGLFQEIALSDIVRMTNISSCQIEHYTPSELMSVVEKCKELNPDFFGMRKKVLNTTSTST